VLSPLRAPPRRSAGPTPRSSAAPAGTAWRIRAGRNHVGTDEPEELLEPLGWEVTAYDLGSFLVDALRALMVVGGHSVFGLVPDFLVQLATLTGLVLLAARLYPSVTR